MAKPLCYPSCVYESRKPILLIAASILAAGKLAQIEKPCRSREAAIVDAISNAQRIMERIDPKWPRA
jgi:hypothetical protein